MENNEIMNNEEVMEATTEIVTAKSGTALKAVVGVIGLAALAGYPIYRYVAKPLIAKHKAKKEKQEEVENELHILEERSVDDDIEEE